jgi:hypothetical protein
MVEVFITDIQNEIQANEVSGIIQNENAGLKINFDLNETDFPFPCGHTILRIEGGKINSGKILSTVSRSGFNCEILEDKICVQKRKQ